MNYNVINGVNVRRSRKLAIFLGLLGFVCYNAYALWCKFEVPRVRKPHIILIVADDVGWNDVSFHGASEIPTPNIDALAYNGVILNRHYVLPTCTPSRSALMTARYPIRDGMQARPLSPGEARGLPLNVTLLPEHMRRLGYETRLLGKWHLGYHTESRTPTRRGFDAFFGFYNGYVTYFNKTVDSAINHFSYFTGYDLHRDTSGHLGAALVDDKYFTDLITDEAVRIIKGERDDKPLFLEIAHLAAHSNGDDLEVRDATEVDETFAYINDANRRKYAGVVKALDDSVGRVVEALSEAGMLDNSIILFMSDNGAPTIGLYRNSGSNYPLRGMKNTLFEGGVRGVACVFSPLIKKPRRLSEEYVHVTDWLPTLYSAAGGEVTDLGEIDGLDQWASIVYGSISPRHNVLVNIELDKMEAAIVGRYKLVKGATGAYHGDTGNDPSYPAYNAEDALISPAGRAIGRLSEFTGVSVDEAWDLLSAATVSCERAVAPKNCSDTCLFDIVSDPCETQDLSSDYSVARIFMLHLLQLFIEKYRPLVMSQTYVPIDSCSLPQYFNGTWMPWRKDDGTLIKTIAC